MSQITLLQRENQMLRQQVETLHHCWQKALGKAELLQRRLDKATKEVC